MLLVASDKVANEGWGLCYGWHTWANHCMITKSAWCSGRLIGNNQSLDIATITSKAFVATWQTAVRAAAMSGSAGDGDALAASALACALAVATAIAVVIRSCASCLNAHTTLGALATSSCRTSGLSQLSWSDRILHLCICTMMLACMLMECVCNLRMLRRIGDLKANKVVHTVAYLPCADMACGLRVQKQLVLVQTR